MEEAIRKSEVLIEALPYISKFFEKVVVIKYGGSSMDDKEAQKRVLQDIVFMRCAGMKPVLVHGGGPEISKRLEEEKIEVKFINGLRVTCERSMTIVDEVLWDINKQLVAEIKALGGEAFGLSGKENSMIQTVPKQSEENLGYVGSIDAIDTTILQRLIDTDIIPVICPVGKGKDNKLYNINGDEAASSIAMALKAEKFVLMTNVRGVLRDKKDPASLLHSLTAEAVEILIKRGSIEGGMLPKVNACLNALKGGVRKAHIVEASLPHALLLEFFTDKGIGTEIVQ
ncbi:MAG TPA: acetylglutamate kinase [Candidatus Omnitrophota bacterium]|nr:acetylglutamate kinase [Candidatus Omnitrophota bacterium]HPS20695.1 acetylglutamate kinase [Candidatus Omnitrophota bacterium]